MNVAIMRIIRETECTPLNLQCDPFVFCEMERNLDLKVLKKQSSEETRNTIEHA